MTSNDHYSHSTLVRNWRAKQPIDVFGLRWAETKTCYMRSPHEGYLVQVSFSTYAEHPEYVRIRSTNWRAEHEPSGVYHIADGRKFWSLLKTAGFVIVEPATY